MHERIERAIHHHWRTKLEHLRTQVADELHRLQDILTIDAHHRKSAESAGASRDAAGEFAAATVDFSSLSRLLRRSHQSHALGGTQSGRLRALHGELTELAGVLEEDPWQPFFAVVDTESADAATSIAAQFEAHIAPAAAAFGLLRAAALMVQGEYRADEHDAFFARFSWRELDNSEMLLCPPLVATLAESTHVERRLASLLELLGAGLPLKLVDERSSLYAPTLERGRAAALQAGSDHALLFLALRTVFFAQSSLAAGDGMEALIADWCDSPRPALLSWYTGAPAGSGAAAEVADPSVLARTDRARRSRAFPHLVYDPEGATDFVSCLDLSDNPAVDERWASSPSPHGANGHGPGDGDTTAQGEPYTFADFAGEQGEYANQFTPLAEAEAHSSVPLATYLQLPAASRRGSRPFVVVAGRRMVPSAALIAHTADCEHLWHTLQELAGIGNPHVEAAEARVAEGLQREHEAALQRVRADADARLQTHADAAVATALRNLAERLADVRDPAVLTASGASEVAAPPPSTPRVGAEARDAASEVDASEVGASEVGEADAEPWIDPKLCTSCDECVDINRKIFAYDGGKKAFIQDAAAGPYRDIVRAAEKCASRAIHPGLPLDPAEKDTGTWIERAQPYL